MLATVTMCEGPGPVTITTSDSAAESDVVPIQHLVICTNTG